MKEKMLGCLYGQAIGDALGLGTEFLNKDEVRKAYPNGISKYKDIIQDAHRRRWHKGAWTDDTDMMICIMTAFENGYFNVHQVAQHFKDWFEGEPMGIGSHTYKVLCMSDYVEQPEMCSKLWWELSRKQSAANGALMRTSVVGLAPDNVEEQAEKICKLTIGVADATPFLEQALETDGYFSRQYPLVVANQIVENKPKGESLRKALAELNGQTVVVMSKEKMTFHDFSQSLVDLEVTNAIYLVGGKGYGFAMGRAGEKVEFGLKLRKMPPNTNYIVWR